MQELLLMPFCQYHFITIKESEIGDGFLDYFFIYHEYSVALEIKLSSNPSYPYTPATQLREYMNRVKTSFGIYCLFLTNKGDLSKTKEEFREELIENYHAKHGEFIEFVIIDGRKRTYTPSHLYQSFKK